MAGKATKRGGKPNLRPSAKKEPVTRIPKMVDTKVMGLEPQVEGVLFTDDDFRKVTAFNWYNYFHTQAESKAWTLHWLKRYPDNGLSKKISKVSDALFPQTVGWICRMQDRGAIFSEKTLKWKDDKLQEMIDRYVEPKPKVTNLLFKTPVHYASVEALELLVDEFFESNYTKVFSTYDYLAANDVKKLVAIAIGDHFKPLRDELSELVTSPSKDLSEGYRHINKSEQRRYFSLINSIVEDCERWSSNKTVVAKTVRAPKKKSVEQVLKGFKFKTENTEMKIVSINPSQILSATGLVVYNDKSRKLIIYKALPGETLSVKGTALINLDESNSKSKTLRKPEAQLSAFLTGTSASLDKKFEEIPTKHSIPSVRLNADTLILKAIK